MLPKELEQLKRLYTDQYVMVASDRPDLARFLGVVGQVKTINGSGRALVQFDAHNDRGWYDIEVEHLKIVEKPPPKPVEKKAPATKPKSAETAASNTEGIGG